GAAFLETHHGIGQAINCIEQQKDGGIAIIGSRL
ncbi:phospholipase, partial [Cronobacter muytjensii]|nr:phospholipase [Cronobacter muytjensii]